MSMMIKTIRNTFALAFLCAMLAACGGASGSAQGSDGSDVVPRPVEPLPDRPGPGDDRLDPRPDPKPDPKPDPADRSASLQWDTPITRTDGSCLTSADVQSYRISYGLAPNNYDYSIDVPQKELSCTVGAASSSCGSSSTCSYTIEDMGTASWYFAVQTIDSEGQASNYSNEIIKTIE